jgi:cell division protein FtsB
MKTDVDTRDQARQRTGTRPAQPGRPAPPKRAGEGQSQPPRQHQPGRRPAGLPPGPPRPPRPSRAKPAAATRPAGPAGTTRTAPAPPRTASATASTAARPAAARPAGQARAGGSRMPFMLLVLSLLGGGLVCLLIVNTTLSTAQVRISDLQQRNAQLNQEQQTLQQQIATDEAPATIEKSAFRLGMREQKRLFFLDVRSGRIYRQPNHMAGEPNVVPVPGFTP